jgi:glycosyltransferase involved in cell wall biosynthesis
MKGNANKAVCLTLWFHGANNVRYTDLFPRLDAVLRVHKVRVSRHRILRGVQYRLWKALKKKVVYPGALRYLSRRYETLLTGDCHQIPAWPKKDSVVVDMDDPVFSPQEIRCLNMPQVKAVIVTTKRAKRMLEQLGVQRSIHVIPQGVSVEQVDPLKVAEIHRRFRQEGDIVVGYPAPTLTLSTDGPKRARQGQDDLDFLFAAIEKARESEPKIKLWLMGRISESVKAYVEERKDWIRAFGYVPFPDILSFIASIDLGVYPRTWVQPPARFNLKLAQFMAFGVPVVSTDLDESFILKEAQSGIVCQSKDDFTAALVGLARSPEKRFKLGSAGRTYARENLDWSLLLPMYRNILTGDA